MKASAGATNDRIVTVFGGTGFLGRRVVRQLCERGFSVRVASRHPHRDASSPALPNPRRHAIAADIHDQRSVAEALAGAAAAVNAVSLYVEHAGKAFHAVHVEAAERIAAQAQRAGVERLVHVSGIGADPASPSLYIRKRGEGELAVRAVFAGTTLVRPAVMFGPDDAFLTTILALLRRLPAYPMFGRGRTRLQPAYVEDVAAGIANALQNEETLGATFECGGPRVYSYEELLRAVAREAGLTPLLLPVPFGAWHVLAWGAENLPSPLLTRNQVELMEVDNVASPKMPGLPELGAPRHTVEEILQQILRAAVPNARRKRNDATHPRA